VAGVKGFAGGSSKGSSRFGEDAIKAFVDACIAEELKLEKALFQLRTRIGRVAALLALPSDAGGRTVEISPFSGHRLSGPIDQLRPNVAIHGHAHRGPSRELRAVAFRSSTWLSRAPAPGEAAGYLTSTCKELAAQGAIARYK